MWLCANRNQLTLVRSQYLTVLVVSIQIGFGPSLATASGSFWTHPSMSVCLSVCFMDGLVTHEEARFKHRGVVSNRNMRVLSSWGRLHYQTKMIPKSWKCSSIPLQLPNPLWGVISPEIENESGLDRKDTTKIHNHAQSVLKVNPPDKQIPEERRAADLKGGFGFLNLRGLPLVVVFLPHQGESLLLCNIERI